MPSWICMMKEFSISKSGPLDDPTLMDSNHGAMWEPYGVFLGQKVTKTSFLIKIASF